MPRQDVLNVSMEKPVNEMCAAVAAPEQVQTGNNVSMEKPVDEMCATGAAPEQVEAGNMFTNL